MNTSAIMRLGLSDRRRSLLNALNELMKQRILRTMTITAEDQIQNILNSARDRGFHDGWRAAVSYVRWRLARSEMLTPRYPWHAFVGNPFKLGTGQAKVYEYIKANPGKHAAEIIANVQVSPKTVSNACHRLKKKNLAINEDGWRLT